MYMKVQQQPCSGANLKSLVHFGAADDEHALRVIKVHNIERAEAVPRGKRLVEILSI